MERERLTQKQARDFLRMLGAKLRVNPEYYEYVLVTGKEDQEQTYFTNSLEDIVGTAMVMLGGHANWKDAVLCLPEDMRVELEEVH